ncbi:MAG: DarT ssDNA thymidine ADP-ribosyltransferase family protein [Pseudothermotoga sp.]
MIIVIVLIVIVLVILSITADEKTQKHNTKETENRSTPYGVRQQQNKSLSYEQKNVHTLDRPRESSTQKQRVNQNSVPHQQVKSPTSSAKNVQTPADNTVGATTVMDSLRTASSKPKDDNVEKPKIDEHTINVPQQEIKNSSHNLKDTKTQDKNAQTQKHPADQTTDVPEYLKELHSIVMERKGYLVHVTESENLTNIFALGGLLSLGELQSRNVSVKHISDDLSRNLDSRNKTLDYVKIAFDESYPMFSERIYRRKVKSPVIIKISPKIILDLPVKISPRNSASNSYKEKFLYMDEPTKFKHLDFEAIYTKPKTWDEYKKLKKTKQAELLVRKCVPVKYFMEILVPMDFPLPDNVPKHMKITRAKTKKILSLDLKDQSAYPYEFEEEGEDW